MEGQLLGVATYIVLHVEVLLSQSDSSSGFIERGKEGGVPNIRLEDVS